MRLRHLLPTVLAALLALQVHAQTEVNGMVFTVIDETERTVSLTDLNSEWSEWKDSVLNVPEKVKLEEGGPEYTVRDIRLGARNLGQANIATVNVARTVTSISLCTSSGLKHIYFPKDSQLKTIGNNAFSRSRTLTMITLPSSLESIGKEAFYMCSELRAIKIPSNVVSMGDKVFGGCTNLKEVILDCKIDSLGQVFSYCTGLEAIDIPSSITKIGKRAFSGCNRLKKVTLNEGIRFIDDYAFDVDSLYAITLPASLETIGYRAFSKVEYVTPKRPIPPSIKYNTFYGYANIFMDDIPKYIAYNKDENWREYRIQLPDPVEQDNVIYRLRDELSVYVLGNTVPKNGLLVIPETVYLQGYPFYVAGINDYALNGNAGEIIIEAPLLSIGNTGQIVSSSYYREEVAFPYLKRIRLPQTLKQIKNSQFYGAPLEEITIPQGVTHIGYNAFAYTSLRSVTLPEGVDTLYAGAFAGCVNLENIQFPKGLKYIQGSAKVFNNNKYWGTFQCALFACSALQEITLPNGIERIDDDVFRSCYAKAFHAQGTRYFDRDGVLMQQLPVEEGGQLILEQYPSRKPEKVYTIDNDVDSVSFYAFTSYPYLDYAIDTPLETVNFSPSVKWIQGFFGSDVTNVNVPEGAVGLGRMYTNRLQSLHLPKSLKFIAGGELKGSSITRIYLEGDTPVKLSPALTMQNEITILDQMFCVKPSVLAAYKADSIWSLHHLVSTEDLHTTDNLVYMEQTDGSAILIGYEQMPTGDLTIPAQVNIKGTSHSVTAIDKQSFMDSPITSVSIPASVDSIGTLAFNGSSVSKVNIGNDARLSLIKASAFSACRQLKEFTLPSSVKEIQEDAFYLCDSMTQFTIPESNQLEMIGDYAFANSSIEYFHIPAQTQLGKNVFNGCFSLKDFGLDAANPYYKVIGGALYSAEGTVLEAYAAGSDQEELILPDGVQEIENITFRFPVLKRLYLLGHDWPQRGSFTWQNTMPDTSLNLIVYVRQSLFDDENYNPYRWSSMDGFEIVPISDEEADNLLLTLGIEETTADHAQPADNRYYRLDGQQTERPTRGIYIHNGKKVIRWSDASH